MTYPRQLISQKVKEQGELMPIMILKQESCRLLKICIHKHRQYINEKHALGSHHLD